MPDLTFDAALALLETAGVWEEMLAYVEMEPLPAGRFIVEGNTLSDVGAFHIAGDSSGGAYLRLSDGSIVLASSEGQAARIGPDLRTALAIGLGTGGLMDALGFTGGPDAEAASTAWQAFRDQRGLEPGEAEDIAEIRAVLELPEIPDPFARLFAEVAATPPGLIQGPDGAWPGFGKL